MENQSKKYICVNCGYEVNELYKKYSASVLKIINCVIFNWNKKN